MKDGTKYTPSEDISFVTGTAEKAHFVPEPLYYGTANEYAAFQGIVYFSIDGGRNGCYKSVIAYGGLVSCIHKYEISCAVCIFYVSLFKTELSEKSGLLVSGYACNGNF